MSVQWDRRPGTQVGARLDTMASFGKLTEYFSLRKSRTELRSGRRSRRSGSYCCSVTECRYGVAVALLSWHLCVCLGAVGWEMRSLMFCFPFPSLGAGSKPRALETSPWSCVGPLSGSLPQDVSGRLRAPVSVSLPGAHPRCWWYILGVYGVTTCMCTFLSLSSAFCVMLLHCLLIIVARLLHCNRPSFPLPLRCKLPACTGTKKWLRRWS